jgi:hypothetical protein
VVFFRNARSPDGVRVRSSPNQFLHLAVGGVGLSEGETTVELVLDATGKPGSITTPALRARRSVGRVERRIHNCRADLVQQQRPSPLRSGSQLGDLSSAIFAGARHCSIHAPGRHAFEKLNNGPNMTTLLYAVPKRERERRGSANMAERLIAYRSQYLRSACAVCEADL